MTVTATKPNFNCSTFREVFNQLAGREFNDREELSRCLVPFLGARFGSSEQAISRAEQAGWLIEHPEHGLIISMHVWKTQPKPEPTSNNVDALLAVIAGLREDCRHHFQAEGEIKLFESRVENVWVESNANLRMGHGTMWSVTPVAWKCKGCSITQSADYCIYCPFCQHKLSNIPGTLEKYTDFATYIENWNFVHQDTLFVFGCHYCNANFIRPEK